MKWILITPLVLMLGCASAEQRMESKEHYREAQVKAIEVQANAGVSRQQVKALEQQAMWEALARAVEANPDAAGQMAIVAAVAVARTGGASGESNTPIATLRGEQNTTLEWAKVLTGPVVGSLTQVGIAALNTDLQKEISRNNTQQSIAETMQDGRIYDMIGVIAENRNTGGDVYNVTDNAVVTSGDNNNTNVNSTPEAAPVTSPDAPDPSPEDGSDEDGAPEVFSLADDDSSADQKDRECKTDGPLRFVPGQGWTFCNGEGWVLGGPEDEASSQMYLERQADFVAQIGAWEQYSGGSMGDLKGLLTGNTWWRTRLQTMANEVAAGDDYWFRREFSTTSPEMKNYALEVVNRYIALQNAGYTDSEINAYIWG